MSGNAQPQFTRQANISSVLVTAARSTSDGSGGTIGTDMFLAFTADATNGSYVELARIIAVASAAATTTNTTVIRLYISSITSGSTTTANTFLIAEITIPSVSADQAAASINWYDVPLGFRLPAGWTILASTGTANAASTAWRVTVVGGDY